MKFPAEVEKYLNNEQKLPTIFERQSFKDIKDEDAKDFVKRLLSPFYKKLWKPQEYHDEADDEASETFKEFSFKKDSPSIGSVRMSTLQALSHPWIEKIS